jgi:hypothetical protein
MGSAPICLKISALTAKSETYRISTPPLFSLVNTLKVRIRIGFRRQAV